MAEQRLAGLEQIGNKPPFSTVYGFNVIQDKEQDMKRSYKISFPLMALLLASLACATPGIATPAPNTEVPGALNTVIAQTVVAALTLDAESATSTPSLEATVTSTFTPEPPTATPTETLTPTAIFTFTPTVPLISVTVPTNCRMGPGKVYDMVGALLLGETAEVFGRDATNNYWYIRNPDTSPEFCWVWGQYAILTGPFMQLPVYTPPPTPTPTFTPLPTFTATPSPSFKAEYVSKDTCSGSWWAEIKLRNNGTVNFRSIFISVKDTVSGVTNAQLNDGFTDRNGCLETFTRDKIAPGDTYLLSASPFNYDPVGHKIEASITLCSETGQKGVCVTRNIDFTP